MDAPDTLPHRDFDLPERLFRGDSAAWAEFVTHYGPHIKRVVRYHLSRGRHGFHDSDDFVQETFLRVVEKVSLLRRAATEHAFRALLRTMVRNLIIDARRKDRLHALNGLGVWVLEVLAGPRATPSVHNSLELKEVLDQVGDELRHMLELRLAGYCTEEIARLTGRNIRTVYRRLQEAGSPVYVGPTPRRSPSDSRSRFNEQALQSRSFRRRALPGADFRWGLCAK